MYPTHSLVFRNQVNIVVVGVQGRATVQHSMAEVFFHYIHSLVMLLSPFSLFLYLKSYIVTVLKRMLQMYFILSL